MKTKISHLGRSTVSVILAVMMLLSTMLIGTISTANAVDTATSDSSAKYTIHVKLADKLESYTLWLWAWGEGGNAYGNVSWKTDDVKVELNDHEWHDYPFKNSVKNWNLIIAYNTGQTNFENKYNSDVWITVNGDGKYDVSTTAPTTTYTVKYGVNGGNGELIATGVTGSGSAVNSGTNVTFKATPSEGYAVEGWYSDAECKNAISGAGNNTSYEVTVNANTNVYVKFKSTTIDPEYRLIGDLFGGWNGYNNAIKFDAIESDGSYSKIITVENGDLNNKHFKLIDGSGKYYGPNDKNVDICGFGASSPYDTYKDTNFAFNFSEAGTYKIHYIVKTGKNTPSVWVEETTTKYYTVTVASGVSAIVNPEKLQPAKRLLLL